MHIALCFRLIGGSDYKLIYRHYATLYFVFCVDSSESELGILDLIQVGLLILDVCRLGFEFFVFCRFLLKHWTNVLKMFVSLI